MQTRFMALIGAVVAIAAGAVIVVLPNPGPTPPAPASAETAAAAEEVAPARTTVVTEAEAPAPGELRFRRLIVEAAGDAPEACLVFSAPLDGTGATRYADFVALPVGAKVSVRVDNARLCLAGLPYGAEHKIELRQGLRAAKGETLKEAVPVTVSLSDRPSTVSFGGGFILPRETAEGLPVTTVNIDRLDLSVYRVGDRLLARMRQAFVDQRTLYSYDAEQIEQDEGRLVWTGTMPVTGPRNDAVVSLIPLAEAVGTAEPGAYLVTAKDSNPPQRQPGQDYYYYDPPVAAQWVVQSDLGLTSFEGADGLTLVARSLKTARPVAGVRLTLIARNNDELGEATTDGDGRVRFDPGLLRGTGGLAPVMAMAYRGGDFNFIDLRRPTFDLSDRGVDGRPPAGPVDAFLYTERGIYRPGEAVELVTLLRDPRVQAVEGRSLLVKVMKPDGKEYRRFTVRDEGAGAGHVSIRLPASANRGGWEATAHTDPDGEPVGRVGFEVQDFVPQRLGLTIGERPAVLKPSASLSIPVEARFLYGAPASRLGGEAELTVEPDPAPFPQHKGFRWGIADEKFAGSRTDLAVGETDAEGRTTVTGTVPAGLTATLPLRADLSIAIREPGGRTTGEHVYVPLRLRPVSLGLRPQFDGSVREGQDAAFDVIAVDEAGGRIALKGVEYRILKDSSTWQWFRSGSAWRYQRVARETEVAAGTLELGTDAPAVLRQTVGWGSYRLVLRDAASGAATSVGFWGGWYGNASAERPDRLRLATDKAGYQPGETARLHVESDAEGEALLVIANEQVHETRSVHIPAGGGDITVPVRADWGPGAYALVTLYRPLDDKLGHAPVRAVGVAWLGLDPARRTLEVAIGAPERTAPRGRLSVPVTVKGGDRAFVTLAAVDQGILQLTRFQTPSPQKHYLSKRRLGVGMRDDYGRLIRGLAGQNEGEGGDAFGGKGLDVVPTRTVALFSGIVAVGRDGTASIPLEIPDFQGELRLMAVAFDGGKVGSAESRVTVRDPLVAELILPRFLAPGDTGFGTVLLHNLDGAAGDYQVGVAAKGAVGGGTADRTVALAKGQREIFTVPVEGGAAGIGTLQLAVRGPGGFEVSRLWPIQIRPPQLPEVRQSIEPMAPGAEAVLGRDLLDGFIPGTGAVSVSVSRWQGLDVPGLLRWLDRYPFGCLEQTTSRAMPLLFFNEVALLAGSQGRQEMDARVQEAVDRILSMQAAEGGFRMWGQWGGDADPWISVFAMDFLMRAADKGFDVPEGPLALGREWLTGEASRHERPEVRAYAFALLARSGRANAADLRYFHDAKPPSGAMAFAHLGAALDAVGERARAASSYDQARNALAPVGDAYKPLPYGSKLRDTYGVAAIMAGAGRAAQVAPLLTAGSSLGVAIDQTTTQDKAWMLLAAAELGHNAGRLTVELDGKPLGTGDPVSAALTPADIERGVRLRNGGDGELFRVVSAEGVPAEPLPAAGTGMSLRKQVFTLQGEPADLAAVKRNDRLVVVVEGRADEQVRGDYAILDLLPAGWEIEGTLRPEQPGYGWLGRLSEAQMRQGRDDRFVAAISLPDIAMDRSDPDMPTLRRDTATWDFKVAYTVRAVSPGSFALPAAVAEHMYVPRLKARTDMGRLVIAE